MNHRWLLVAPLAFALSAIDSGTHAAPASGLERAARDYDRAQVTGDRQLLKQLLADDYLLVNSGGETETKTQFITDLTDPTYHLQPFTVLHPVERHWNDGAVLGGVSRLVGTSAGKPFDVCLRFADIWAHRQHGWQVIYTQAARAKREDCG